jgi:uncharacterized protein VirK/YbjX
MASTLPNQTVLSIRSRLFSAMEPKIERPRMPQYSDFNQSLRSTKREDKLEMKNEVTSPDTPRRPHKLSQAAGLVWRVLTNLGTLRPVIRFLSAPLFIDVVQDNPKLALKYLTDSYLMNGLPVKDRADCFLHHYRMLQERVPTRALRQMLTWGVDLCEINEGGVRFVVRCGLSRRFSKEGEQSLVLLADGEVLYTIAFTFVPGHITQSKHPDVVLVSRVQGEPAFPYDKLKIVQQAAAKLRFGSLLLSSLDGIAQAFGIKEIACVSSELQLAYFPPYAGRFKHAYEDLFLERGFVPSERGLYVSPVPVPERTLGEGKRNYDERYRDRRTLLRKQVSASCHNNLRCLLRPSTVQPPVEIPDAIPPRLEHASRPAQQEAALPGKTSSLSFG